MTAEFLTETRGQQNYISKVPKEKNCQSRVLYIVKISFRNEDTSKHYQARKYLELVTKKPILKELLKKKEYTPA